MSKYLNLIICLTMSLGICTNDVIAQRIEQNETDEFTGVKKIATDWGTLYMKMGSTLHYRVRVLDGKPYLQVKLFTGTGLVSVRDNHHFMLKLENDSVVKLPPLNSSVGCYGCASLDGFIGSKAAGISVLYVLSSEIVNTLVTFGVEKTRLYTNDGYFEEVVNPKKAIIFREYFKLLWPRGVDENFNPKN